MPEIWKSVPNYEGIYEVSNQGRIQRIAPSRGTHRYRLLKPSLGTTGYLNVTLSIGDITSHFRLHRLVAHAFLGPSPIGKEVNHKNGDRTDARLTNLEYVTRSQNHRHAYRVLKRKHHDCKGSANGHAVLIEDQVIRIRSLYQSGHTQTSLGKEFGVTQGAVWHIVHRRQWRHI